MVARFRWRTQSYKSSDIKLAAYISLLVRWPRGSTEIAYGESSGNLFADCIFNHTRQILPQRLEFAATVTAPGDVPPQTFLDFAQSGMMEPLGEYQGVFAYAFKFFPGDPSIHYWAFCIWDRIIFTAIFHDPKLPLRGLFVCWAALARITTAIAKSIDADGTC